MTNRLKARTFFFFLIVCMALAHTSCGGSSSDGSDESTESTEIGAGSGNATTDTLTTFNTVAMVISTSLSVNAPSGSNPRFNINSATVSNQHVHCTSGGPATINGSFDSSGDGGTFDLTADLGNCEGLDGTISFSGSYQTVGDNYEFTVGFTGNAGGNGCLVALDHLTYVFEISTTLITAPLSESAKDTMTATCTEGESSPSVSCDFGTGVVSNNATLMTAACSCTGGGCEG